MWNVFISAQHMEFWGIVMIEPQIALFPALDSNEVQAETHQDVLHNTGHTNQLAMEEKELVYNTSGLTVNLGLC